MTSIRNNASTEDRVLDAARDCILSVGWKRTTITDVARRAGVSRMTVYRTYPDMTSIFGDLMTREWVSVMAEVMAGETAEGDEASWPQRIADQLVHSVAALRLNPLFHRIVDVDPELLLPYLLDRRGRSQQAVLELLGAGIAEGQAAGGLRDGDPQLLARAVLLTAQGFVLSPQTMVDQTMVDQTMIDQTMVEGAVTLEALDAELADLVRRYLTP